MEISIENTPNKIAQKNFHFSDAIRIVLANLRRIPIEAYVLIALPLMGIISMVVFYPNALSFNTLLYYFFFGSNEFVAIFIVLYVYFVVKITLPLLKQLIHGKRILKEDLLEIRKHVIAQLYFSSIFLLSGFFINFLVNNLVIISSAQKIARATNLLIDYDYGWFGGDLLFWLNSIVAKSGSATVSWLLVESYKALTLILIILPFIFLLKDKKLFKKFIIFFFIIQLISVPIWTAMPVLGPINFYIANVLGMEPQQRIAAQMANYQPDYMVSAFMENHKSNIEKSGNYTAVTAFPSMHAGWGLGIIIYAFLLWPPSIFIFMPWYILQLVGSVYLGEHYAVDLFLGAAVAVIAYFLVELVFLIEKKYYKGGESLIILDIVAQDCKKVMHSAKQFAYELINKSNR